MWYMCVAPGQALGSVDLTSAKLFASAYDYKISADKPIRIHQSNSASFPYPRTHSHLHTSPALLPLLIRRALSFGTLFDRDRPSARALHSLPSDAWGQLNRLPSRNRKTMAGLQPPAPAPAPAAAPSLSLEPESFIDLSPDSPVLHPRAESKAKKRLRIAVASTFTSASACSSPSSDCSSSAAASSSSSSPPSLPRLVPLSPLSAFSFTLSPASETGTSYIQSDEDSDIDIDPDPDPDLDSETEFETGDEDDSGDDSDTDVGDDESSFVKGYTEDLDEDEGGVGSEEEEEEEEVMSRSTNIHSHPYRYRLLPALSMPRFTPGPSSMYAPWPYTFKKGDVAFALTREGTRTWRRVTVLDNGLLSSFASSIPRKTETHQPAKPSEPQSRLFYQSPNPVLKAINNHYHAPPPSPSPSSPALVYTAQWLEPDPSSPAQTRTMLGSFCPTRGTLKPDDKHTRRLLLLEEGCTLIE
ncbi:hypothetical protein A7U60_g3308 [Sanghuangporus baumii]|uniref:Uncharacterized protein n=1 Tax=Sanghuangporus baumii TaxID=108892 RepID=A0A9Q5I0P7_SANBA|nr:hypothetical protein A7U60_g3308 [Sanghuangporus baumii]